MLHSFVVQYYSEYNSICYGGSGVKRGWRGGAVPSCDKRGAQPPNLFIYIHVHIHILLFIHGSPSGKKPGLQGAMLKKKKAT